jgi:pimeloyl-ACP methyl ester carboxylesterase
MTEFPEPTMIRSNGIVMAVYEAGPKDGLPVVLCHGFPELAYSWRHQLPALAAAGFRAIAPDQRGYGRTSRPEKVEDYDMAHLTGDLAGMLDALGLEKAVFVGHDWGGIVVWQMPIYQPSRVLGVIGVNTPFLHSPIDPIAGLRAMRGENNYVVFFQKPGVADEVLARDVGKTFRFFMRKNMTTAKEFAAAPPQAKNFELVHAIEQDETGFRGEPLLTDAELKVFVDNTYQRTGFTGGINWYRNLTRNWQQSQTMEQIVRVPGLMIMAEDDVVLPPSMTEGMESFVPDLERVLIRNCGHWTQQEHPEETSRAMIEWLKRRFPH